ncbi:putative membrane protein [Candidatus Protochlamydia naegleriophila]|uniref:Putative membrane protein n=1 Tax=Candidatus Protochlamydia naegleriophila TaxID=389348 RepID=A0A0U5CS87_9BACT|nr:hypothetical protein [Candidatus Protochlamydia naegleriophila]CUI17884.1 putative membrane protein [Candidatus Protochlamydia naegleriophila]
MKTFLTSFFLLPWLLFANSSMDALIQEASASYRAAEEASTFQERKNGFNRALTLYQYIESQPGVASADLDQALANSYFQLGEYAWSILYNERALQLDPYNPTIIEHLVHAQKKLGLPPSSLSPSWVDTLLLRSALSLPARFQLFFYTALAAILLATVLIWIPSSYIKKLVYLTGLLTLALAINLMISFYFTPLYGIFISSTALYRAPSFQETQLTNLPFAVGSKVRIIQSEEQGFWLKVMDQNGLVGYVPASDIRLI